jgi:hypothetical protein
MYSDVSLIMLGATKIMNSFHIAAQIPIFSPLKRVCSASWSFFVRKLAGLGSGVVDTVNLLTIYVLN